ncbi:hypothetical protein CEP54_002101 [Fusarium duplospermum]|uniref:Uncharacterized protein n=1 Tax=Fusarium duplospermum TaxID=1325734 RepID=A0A428QWK3_9HYPO|nr:hypothetical protein CEP54_002101 [Fusarium duplospermum]
MATHAFALEHTPLNSIRSIPSDTYLLHATNCLAQWGAGIAAELATVFPAACRAYKRFCNSAKANPSERWPPRSLAGRCLIIPPQPSDVAAGAPSVHIICLFTSYGYGRPSAATGKPGRDNVARILAQTESALKDLRAQLLLEAGVIIYSPKFNSGAFSVPWESTAEVIEKEFADWDGSWLIMAPP